MGSEGWGVRVESEGWRVRGGEWVGCHGEGRTTCATCIH